MRYRIGVDIGGTFTDCVVTDEQGARHVAKALTTPGSLQDGVLDAVAVNAEQLGMSRQELLASTELFVHGTTQATNAMLTRTGARTGLITTRGHEDAIIIGKVYAKVAGLSERDVVHSSRLRKPDPIVPRAPVRVSIALVACVVPWTNRSVAASSSWRVMPSCSALTETASSTPS